MLHQGKRLLALTSSRLNPLLHITIPSIILHRHSLQHRLRPDISLPMLRQTPLRLLISLDIQLLCYQSPHSQALFFFRVLACLVHPGQRLNLRRFRLVWYRHASGILLIDDLQLLLFWRVALVEELFLGVRRYVGLWGGEDLLSVVVVAIGDTFGTF